MQHSALIPAWTPQQKAAFGRRPVVFNHRLVETGLFSDEQLAAALDRYPPELCDINLFDFDAEGQHVLRTGGRGTVTGAQVLEGLKTGRLWMHMRQATRQGPDWGAAIDQAYREIAGQMGGRFKPKGVSGGLLLSSPDAAVPMHADAPWVVLFHLRGRKRIWIYPNDEAHMPRAAMEQINMRQQTEDLPYSRAMDAKAEVFDLEPGMAISWPLHAPHRVENLGLAHHQRRLLRQRGDAPRRPARGADGPHADGGADRAVGPVAGLQAHGAGQGPTDDPGAPVRPRRRPGVRSGALEARAAGLAV